MSDLYHPTPFIFAPGRSEHFADGEESYKPVMDAMHTAGGKLITPVFVALDWSKNPAHWDEQVLHTALRESHNTGEVFLAGFSLGAVAAVRTAARLQSMQEGPRVKGLLLASLAPRFAETVDGAIARVPTTLSEEVLSDYRSYSFPDLKVPTQLYVGEREGEYMHRQAKLAQDHLPYSELMIVADAGHDLRGDSRYYELLAQQAGRFFVTAP